MSGGPSIIFHLDDARLGSDGHEQVCALHEGLLALGEDSRMICHRGGALHEWLVRQRLPHYALPFAGRHDLAAAWRIRHLVRDASTVLHAHTPQAHQLALWVRRFGGRARLVVSRRPDPATGGGWTRHWPSGTRGIDRFVAATPAVERDLVGAGIDPSRIRHVPAGIDLSGFAEVEPDLRWRARLRLQPGELLFCSLAEPGSRDAAALLPAFRHFLDGGGSGRLVILAGGEPDDELLRRHRQLGLADHVFLDPTSGELPGRLCASDVFVSGAVGPETAPGVLDAMALARPVVAVRSPATAQAVVDAETGLLVDSANPSALAHAMGVLQRSAATRQRMGLAGAARVQRFDLRQTVADTLAVYRELFVGPEVAA